MSNNCKEILGPSVGEFKAPKCTGLNATDSFPTKQVNELAPSLLVISSHGNYNKTDESHYVSLHQEYRTNDVILQFAGDQPMNILLLSCFSGTNTSHLLQGTAKGSAIISTSRENSVALVYLTEKAVEIYMEHYQPELNNFEEAFVKSLPIMAGVYAKYTTHKGVLDVNPPMSVFASRENAREYLIKLRLEFEELIDRKLPVIEYSDAEVDTFTTYLFSTLISIDKYKAINFVGQNDNEYLIQLCEAGKDETGHSLIQKLVEINCLEIVKCFLDRGLNPNTLVDGKPLIFYRLYEGKPIELDPDSKFVSIFETEMLKKLIAHGADINAKVDGLPLLAHAIMNKYHGAMSSLINFGADINISGQGMPLIWYAILADNDIAIRELLSRGVDASMNIDGLSLIHHAIKNQNLAAAGELFKHGAKLDFKDGFETVIIDKEINYYAMNKSLLSKLITEKYITLSQENANGLLTSAIINGDSNIVSAILKNDIKPAAIEMPFFDPRNIDQNTLMLLKNDMVKISEGDATKMLSNAIYIGNDDLALLALKYGADPYAINVGNYHLISKAVKYKLIELGVYLDLIIFDENTVRLLKSDTLKISQNVATTILKKAIDVENDDVALLALEHGANPNVVNEYNYRSISNVVKDKLFELGAGVNLIGDCLPKVLHKVRFCTPDDICGTKQLLKHGAKLKYELTNPISPHDKYWEGFVERVNEYCDKMIEVYVEHCYNHDRHEAETANCMEILAQYENIAAVIHEKGLMGSDSIIETVVEAAA